MSLIANQLERGRCGHAHGGSLLERQAGRLLDEVILRSPGVFGKGTRAPTEYLVSWSKPLHILADRFDRPRDIGPGNANLRLAQSGRHAHEVGRPGHEDQVTQVDRGRMDVDQNLVVRDLGLRDVPCLQDPRRAIPVLNDCLHVWASDFLYTHERTMYAVWCMAYATAYNVRCQARLARYWGPETWCAWPHARHRQRSPGPA